MADQGNTHKSPQELRAEIEATRQRMDQHLSQLEIQLNPQRLKTQATQAIREQTVGRVEHFADNAADSVKGASSDVFDTIKSNPIPAALAAIGLGWLFVESRNKSSQRNFSQRANNYGQLRGQERFERESFDRNRPYGQQGFDRSYDYRYAAPAWESEDQYRRGPMDKARDMAGNMGDRAQHFGGKVGDTASNLTSGVADTASNMAGSVADTASNVANSVADTASNVASSVADTASNVASSVADTASNVASSAQAFGYQAQDQMGEWADAAQHSAGRVRSRFEELMETNPLLIGAAAVALGAAIGMSLPSTPVEDNLMGEKRDQFVEQAQHTAQDTAQKVQQVASKAGEAAKDAAKDAAQDEAEKQNLTTH